MGPTCWRGVLLSDINAFAAATYEPDLMHIDPAWAAEHRPFGRSIAFGSRTFSLLTSFLHELEGHVEGQPNGEFNRVNYGFDRLRFIDPVPVGAHSPAR